MLMIEVVSDVVCPWCFIGKRRLEKAVELVRAERPHFQAAVRWHPYFLNPDTAPAGEPYLPFLERKFGGPGPVAELFARVRAAGRTVGIEFAFEKILLRANTLQAHRLIHWAQQRTDASPVVERLFRAQFIDGEHVGDTTVLLRIAAECGLDAAALAGYLAGSEDAELVRAEERRVRALGVPAVPTFYFGDGAGLTGAEDAATLAAEIRRALGQGLSGPAGGH